MSEVCIARRIDSSGGEQERTDDITKTGMAVVFH